MSMLCNRNRMIQPRSQSSSAISDVTSPVKLVGKIRLGRYRAIALGSKPPLVTRIARTGLGTRLRMIKLFQNGWATESGTNGTVEKLDCVCK